MFVNQLRKHLTQSFIFTFSASSWLEILIDTTNDTVTLTTASPDFVFTNTFN